MTPREAFESVLRTNRYDWETRKVYSDWLEENGFDDEAAEQRLWTPDWQKSMDWMTECAAKIRMPVEELINHGRDWVENHNGVYGADFVKHVIREKDEETGEEWDDGGNEARDIMSGLYPEFWRHFEIVTRTTVDDRKKESFFTCSC